MFSVDELAAMMGEDPTSGDEEQMAADAAGSWEPSVLTPSPPQPNSQPSQPIDRSAQQLDRSRPTDIHDLPNEILHHVLQFLEKRNLYAAASVNKRWYDSVKKVHKIPHALPAPNTAPVFATDLETAFASADGTRWALDTGYEPTPRSLYVAAKLGVEEAVLVLLDYLLYKGQAVILPITAQVLGERGFISCVKRIYREKIPINLFTTKTMFNSACKSGNLDIVNHIIRYGLPLFDGEAQRQSRVRVNPGKDQCLQAYHGLMYLSKDGHFDIVLNLIKSYRLGVTRPMLEEAARLADLETLTKISRLYLENYSTKCPFTVLFAASPGENLEYVMSLPFHTQPYTHEPLLRALGEGRRDILAFLCSLCPSWDTYSDIDIHLCYDYVNKTGDLDFIRFAYNYSCDNNGDPTNDRKACSGDTLEICMYLQDLIGKGPDNSGYPVSIAAELNALAQERADPTGNRFVASFQCVKWICTYASSIGSECSRWIAALKAEEIQWLDNKLQTPIEIDFDTFLRHFSPNTLPSSERFETLWYIIQRSNLDVSAIDYDSAFVIVLDTPELIKLDALGLHASRAPLEEIIRQKRYDFMRYALDRGCTFLKQGRTDDIPDLRLGSCIGKAAEDMEAFMVLHRKFIAHIVPRNDHERGKLAGLKCAILSEAAKLGLQTMKQLYDIGYRWVNEADGRFHISNLTFKEVEWMMSLGYRPVAKLLKEVLDRGSVRFYKLIKDIHFVIPYTQQCLRAVNAKNLSVAEYIEGVLLSPEQRAKITMPNTV